MKARIIVTILAAVAIILITVWSKWNGGTTGVDESGSDNNSGTTQQSSGSGITTMQIDRDSYALSGIPQPLDRKPVAVGGLQYTASSEWTMSALDGDTLYRYTYGPLENDVAPAEMIVAFQPKERAQAVAAIKKPWYEQIVLPDGRHASSGSIEYTLDVDSMKVHVVSLFGHFDDGTGTGGTQMGYFRFVGAIAEAPEGVVIFRLAGQDLTARIMIEAYVPMLKSLSRISG